MLDFINKSNQEQHDQNKDCDERPQHYFKKPASRLTKAEAARIAACLPNPKKYLASPGGRYVSSRSFAIQRQMNNLSSDPDIVVIIQ